MKLNDLNAALSSFEAALDMAKVQRDEAAESAIKKAIDDVNSKIVKTIKEENEDGGLFLIYIPAPPIPLSKKEPIEYPSLTTNSFGLTFNFKQLPVRDSITLAIVPTSCKLSFIRLCLESCQYNHYCRFQY